jgi:hypothetical protein
MIMSDAMGDEYMEAFVTYFEVISLYFAWKG